MRTKVEAVSIAPTQAGLQSLATGTVGAALLAVEQALNGSGSWTIAHQLVKRVASAPVDAAAHTGLYYGAPAVLFLLNTATADGRDRYTSARQILDGHVRRGIHERLAAAEERVRRGRPAAFAEYDLFYGLGGYGALLLQHAPGSDELGDVLVYLVRLTHPRTDDGQQIPGWWVDHDPDPILPTPGGHVNFGMAHGAAGLLALLAIAARHGHRVDGHIDAIERLCAWFDQWRQETPHGPWWPQWITHDELRAGHPSQEGPGRPSWCYGTPGIARALQLAGIATRQPARQVAAEAALAACLSSPQLDRLTEPGVCHGLAGLYQTAYRAAADARTPNIGAHLPKLVELLGTYEPDSGDEGFLTGRTGQALAIETAIANTPPRTRWDTCLLIT
jgi:hypothetical protein